MNWKSLIIIALIFFNSLEAITQNNSISFNLGIAPFAAQYNFQYERTIWRNDKILKTINANATAGYIGVTNLSSSKMDISLMAGPGLSLLFFGSNKNMELGLKYLYLKRKEELENSSLA